MDQYTKIDELINTSCYVIDPLPQRVERDNGGQYFAVEEYFLQPSELKRLYRKFINILLKLNCYYDFQVSYHEGWNKNPSPATLTDWVFQCIDGKKDYMNIVVDHENVMLIVNGDDLYMSLYNPNREFLGLVEKLAGAEGLFVWQASC